MRKIWAALIALAILSIAIRWPFFRVPLITDEGAYAYIASFWRGPLQLYRDLPIDRPQALFLLYKVPLLLGGAPAIRVFAAVFNAGTLIAIFCVAKALFDARAGLIAAAAWALFSAAPSVEGFTANAELFALLPLTISALFAWRRLWLWAGLLAALAVLVKPIGMSGLLLAGAWILVTKSGWRTLGRLLFGFALPLALAIAHGVAIDARAFRESFIERRLLLYSVVGAPLGAQLHKLFEGVTFTFSAWAAPLVAAALRLTQARGEPEKFCLLWLASSLVGMALGGEWHWHYFLQLLPPLVVLGSAVRLRALAVAALVLALGLFAVRDAPYWLRAPDEISWQLYHRATYLYADETAKVVRDNSAPNDSIYVAIAEAEIYYLSGRRAAAPQLFARELYSEKIRTQVLDALDAAIPAVIVVAQPPPPFDSVEEMLARLTKYEFLRKVGPFVLLKKK